ncbi:MAG: RNA methyltransferase PUA domain-containing protein [Phycisphaerales bacterium]
MATPWFHLDPLPEAGVVLLPKDEARHATGARRLGEGDAVVLFDGRGTLARATLLGTRDRRGDVEARIDAIERRAPISPRIEFYTKNE